MTDDAVDRSSGDTGDFIGDVAAEAGAGEGGRGSGGSGHFKRLKVTGARWWRLVGVADY